MRYLRSSSLKGFTSRGNVEKLDFRRVRKVDRIFDIG